MLSLLSNVDDSLVEELNSLSTKAETIWSLAARDRHDSGHTFFQYPAMMVPSIQRILIQLVKTVQPNIRSLFDPFMGAGTTLTAGMHNGLDCFGQDINPLAVLVAKTRSGPFYIESLTERIDSVIETAKADKDNTLAVDFPNVDKWFRKDVAIELSKLRRAITQEDELWVRRFMWVTLAETIRLTSNDRTTTYKLHARPVDEIQRRFVSPIETFSRLIRQNLRDLQVYRDELNAKGFLVNDKYAGRVETVLGNTAEGVNISAAEGLCLFDLLVTSPPYGDNNTTITYGQHSYLPLQWINLQDIVPDVDDKYLCSTHEIDSRSIGGKRSREVKQQIERLRNSSKSLDSIFGLLADKPIDRQSKVASFYEDFTRSIESAIRVLNKNAYLIVTVGNRRVADIEIPNDSIMQELLESRGVCLVKDIHRTIHNKRMPDRNKITRMMRNERILIFRNQGAYGDEQ